MNTQIQRLGDSLAVRIPEASAEEMGLLPKDEVQITLRDGELILTLKQAKSYTLDELLTGVTPENRPDEWDMGPAVGREVWC